jgi:S-DNA-T family DNA segregation ATPase FtsK/SpoIIIE
VFIVFLFLVATIILLAIFGLAGRLGVMVDGWVSQVFGWVKLFVPFALYVWGYHLMDEERLALKVSHLIGFILFFVSLDGVAHAVTFPPGTLALADTELLRTAGGKLGELVAEPAVSLMGFVGAVSLLVGLFVASLLLMFNTSLETILRVLTAVGKGLLQAGKLLLVPFRAAWNGFMASRTGEGSSVATAPVVEEDEEDEGEEEEEAAPVDSEEEAEEEEEDDATEIPPVTDAALAAPKKRKRRAKIEIPLDLLIRRDQRPTSGDIGRNQEIIQKTLAQFGVPVEMGEVSVGPTVTQFTLKPAEGIKLTRITSLHNDLALALAAHPIRIEAPIPGKPLVGIEVPNQSVATVGLREMLESKALRDAKNPLPFVLGKDVTGAPLATSLAKMPHLLVAGATGSGKSVCLNILLMSLLYGYSPDDLKLILVDPKRVEFTAYNGIPHLLSPVVTNVEGTVNALKWTIREMDRRFDILSKFGSRDIGSYNERAEDKLPYLVFVVDELADLMVQAQHEVEGPIVRIAQMARAVGIHLVLATQRPSVDVITGIIKANVPARIAFAVASATDSRTILDQMGAEKLLGRGDMLMQTSDMPSAKRVQGALISDEEVHRVVDFLKTKYGPADYDETVTQRASASGTVFGGGSAIDDEESDALIPEAKEEILRAGKASASLLQRRLKVGYARAARLLDLLEQEGFIGPGDGAKPREILQSRAQPSHNDQIPAAPRPAIDPDEEMRQHEIARLQQQQEEDDV